MNSKGVMRIKRKKINLLIKKQRRGFSIIFDHFISNLIEYSTATKFPLILFYICLNQILILVSISIKILLTTEHETTI